MRERKLKNKKFKTNFKTIFSFSFIATTKGSRKAFVRVFFPANSFRFPQSKARCDGVCLKNSSCETCGKNKGKSAVFWQ